MIKLTAIVLLLALGLSAPGARGQNRDLGFAIIDHDAFTQLPRQAQHDYLVLIMQTVVEFEQALAHAPAEQKTKLKKTVEVLKTFLRGLTPLDEAHAAATSRACLYGGWFSTYENVGGKDVCRRPNLSSDRKIRDNYRANARCPRPAEQAACNPEIFGTETNNQPTCVDVNRISDTNISLACLLAFEADPQKEARLDRMVKKIKEQSGCAESFNKVVQTIFNTCVCQQNAADNGRNVQMAQQYFEYMSGHRTCYSLVAQTQNIAAFLKGKLAAGQACWAINPQNVDYLANDLRAISGYALRVTGQFPASAGNTPAARMSFLSQHRGPRNAGTLDNLPEYENCLKRLAGDSARECRLTGGEQILARNHCPLELPAVVPPAPTPTCSIDVRPGLVVDGKLHFTATLKLNPERETSAGAVTWKIGDTEQTGNLSFSSSVPASELKGMVQLTATLSLDGKPISCSHEQEHTGTADQTLKACQLGEVVVTKNNDDSFSFATTPTFTPSGVTPDGLIWSVGDTTNNDLVKLRYTPAAGAAPQGRLTLVASQGNQNITCQQSFNLPPALEAPPEAARECKVASVEISRVDGQENQRRVKATLAAELREGETVNWNINGQAYGQGSQGSSIEQVIRAEGRAKVRVSASLNGFELVACAMMEQEEPVADPVAQPQTEQKKCSITLVQAMDDEAKPILDVSITAAGDDAPAEDVKFEGMSFKKTGKASATAAVVRIPRKQVKKIKASYKSVKGENFSCEREVEIPAAEQSAAPGGAPPPQGLPPVQSPPDIFFQGVR